MGNTGSSQTPKESSLPSKKSSVHKDTYGGDNQPAFSFGPELELVLKPHQDKWKELRESSGEFNEILQLIEEKLEQECVTFLEKENRLASLCRMWAECIAMLLRHASGGVLQAIYAHDTSSHKLKENGTYYRYWSVIDDATIEVNPEKGEWSVEIVSCVKYTYDPNWMDEFQKVWSILQAYFEIVTENRGSTHVHLKRIPEKKSEKGLISLAYAKAVSKFVIFWEPCIYLLAPPTRRKATYCRSNLIASRPLLSKLKGLQDDTEEVQTYQAIFTEIDNLKTLEEVVELMCPNGKDFAWNFMYLTSKKSPAKEPTGTIEYRRPRGSRTLNDVFQSVTMSLCFVHGACNVLTIDPDLYPSMANTPVVCSQEKFSPKATGLPRNVQDFGEKHFLTFKVWMEKSAKALGLTDCFLGDINDEKEEESE